MGKAGDLEVSSEYLWTVIVSILAEKAALGERGGAGAAREARRVEVLVGHAQHLAAALAAARAAHHLACNHHITTSTTLPTDHDIPSCTRGYVISSET